MVAEAPSATLLMRTAELMTHLGWTAGQSLWGLALLIAVPVLYGTGYHEAAYVVGSAGAVALAVWVTARACGALLSDLDRFGGFVRSATLDTAKGTLDVDLLIYRPHPLPKKLLSAALDHPSQSRRPFEATACIADGAVMGYNEVTLQADPGVVAIEVAGRGRSSPASTLALSAKNVKLRRPAPEPGWYIIRVALDAANDKDKAPYFGRALVR